MRALHDLFIDSIARSFLEKNIDPKKIPFSNLFKDVLDKLAPLLEKTLMKEAQKTFRSNQKELRRFIKRNKIRWKNGFTLLGAFIDLCTEVGAEYNETYRPEASAEQDYVFDVIIRNHAKSCLIAREVYCLLLNGFADGASARWRSLHEISVITSFIKEHGQQCAKKYLEHQYIELFNEMKIARKFESRTNRQGSTGLQYDECAKICDALILKYGKNFKKKGYGWAADYLAGQNANFANIESSVRLDHWRPYYGDASQYLHGGAAGTTPKLALEECTADVLLTGPSNSGMVEPAHSTALSLALATIPVLLREPISLDSLLLGRIILNISSEVGELFWKDHQATVENNPS